MTFQIDMNAPATLCRIKESSVDARPGKSRDAVVVARGPFLIMAHGYLAQTSEDRPAFWIKSAGRNVMPAEIEEVMRVWQGGGTDAKDAQAEAGLTKETV